MAQFPPFDREKALNELGEVGGKARRDSYIRFLYEREMEFTETLGKVIHSPTFRLAARFAKAAKFVLRKKD